MTRPLPAWGRLLLIGLVVSVVLHGAALDFWRGMAGLEGAPDMGFRQVALQARLQPASADRLSEEPSSVRLGEAVGEKPSARPALPARVAQRSVPRSAVSVADASSAVVVASSVESGLRPLSRAEGLVAYRLALLAVLGAPSARLISPVQLSLSASPGGAQVEIRISSGDAVQDQVWLEAVRGAVLRAEVPEVLAGQAFVLDLEFWP
ncbi:hypothetical protein [Uliginosibacterium flavum]|uniref:Uncharacterized protein n=1 Tax=Uliginosibacterium flavum TaxID=1396831 RepID=A0ABV2TNN0_9RHOO